MKRFSSFAATVLAFSGFASSPAAADHDIAAAAGATSGATVRSAHLATPELSSRLERRTRTLTPEERQRVRSLLRASASNDADASYRLYRYYLDRGLDREAIFFEMRALEQGYTPPQRLSHRRG